VKVAEANSAELDPRSTEVRLGKLFDPGRMAELHPPDDSGVQAARGEIDGSPAIAFCTDPRRMGGAMGAAGCQRIVAAYELALRESLPIVGIWHSGGARLAEGVLALDAVGLVFQAMIRASGKVPQVSVVLGPAAGGAAYGPALTDAVIMAPAARIFVTGPDIVRRVTGEDVDMESLGGPEVHASQSGVAHSLAADEDSALEQARQLTRLLSHPGAFDLDQLGPDPDLGVLLPDNRRRAYDVHPLVLGLLDESSFFEFHARWAPNVLTGLGRLAGRAVGVIANNPLRLGGCLNSASAEKAARFVRMCDAFGIPLVVLVDVPGYLPGAGQETDGVVRRGAKLLHAFGEARVPRVTVVTRKAFGGAYIAMNARSLGASEVFAWPGAEVAVMGATAAVELLHRKRLAAATDDDRGALLAQLVIEHERESGGLDRAVEIGVVDEIIKPDTTRSRVATALAAHPSARGEHGNIPL
jgi:acetyl-CoA/propionyl-CoA carboxylase carboxyl transferase subunit